MSRTKNIKQNNDEQNQPDFNEKKSQIVQKKTSEIKNEIIQGLIIQRGINKTTSSSNNVSDLISENDDCTRENLWSYVIKMHQNHLGSEDIVFKANDPRRYIQIKSSIINGGNEIIVICSDITNITIGQKMVQKMRSTFFSSIAHELRTPLNSIIPIIQMIIDLLKSFPQAKPLI